MSLFIEEDIEDVISADDWSGIVLCPRERIRQELEVKMVEFQKNKGQITVIKQGATANSTVAFASTLVTNKSKQFSQKELNAYAKRKADKLHYKYRNDDPSAVAMLQGLLDTAPNATFLLKQLQCSADRVQRLLSEYFAADPRADKFRHRDREEQKLENEMILAAKIRQCLADGMAGTWPICKHLHASFAAVALVNKKYKLDIPRGKGGRPNKVEGGVQL